MKILIFTEGTVLMHKNGVGKTRKERVKQVIEKDQSVNQYDTYVPIGNAVEKLQKWKLEGAEIIYLTSRTKQIEVDQIQKVLTQWKFPEGKLFSRGIREEYKDIAEKIAPDIVVEDDCESIGGKDNMVITHLSQKAKKIIHPIIIEEFGGIDDAPDIISELNLYSTSNNLSCCKTLQ